MILRQEVFDSYWTFAAERQEIFFKRIKNEPPPWTDNPILREYKFCNTYRASDRVSQHLIRDVIYKGNQNEEETIFRILLFRMFNKIETWQYLEERLGEVRLSAFDFEVYADILQERRDSGQPIFGNAFILCANKAFGYDIKHLNYLALLKSMTQDQVIARAITRAKDLNEVFRILRSYPLLGNFMAYQMAIDLNYSEVISFSENDFTIAGPGAVRGIRKCFTDTQDKSNEHIIKWMVDNQEIQFARLGIEFQSLWGRPLHCIDCQGLFCEVDKYSRAAFPELKSNRKRIKSTFQANSAAIEYFYPPKWGINHKVSETLKQYWEKKRPTTADEPRQLAFDL